MSTSMQVFQSFFSFSASFCILAKLAANSIRAHGLLKVNKFLKSIYFLSRLSLSAYLDILLVKRMPLDYGRLDYGAPSTL